MAHLSSTVDGQGLTSLHSTHGVVALSPTCSSPLARPAQCEGCKEASTASIATAIMGAVTQLLQINGDLGRSTARGDLNCGKTVGVLSGLWGLASTLYALLNFYWSCFETDLGTMHAGVGFWCIVVATVMKAVDVFFHAMLKTPEGIHRGGGGGKGSVVVPDGVEEGGEEDEDV